MFVNHLHAIMRMVILISLINSATSANDKKDFSLIISGGISLGAYEAGYNWGLIKHLNYQKHADGNLTEIKLHSIAGGICRSDQYHDVGNGMVL